MSYEYIIKQFLIQDLSENPAYFWQKNKKIQFFVIIELQHEIRPTSTHLTPHPFYSPTKRTESPLSIELSSKKFKNAYFEKNGFQKIVKNQRKIEEILKMTPSYFFRKFFFVDLSFEIS